MLQDPHFFPVLQTKGWKGLSQVACMCLIGKNEPTENSSIFASYGVVGEDRNAYMTKESLSREGLTLEDISNKSQENLKRHISGLEWEKVDVPNINVLCLQGDENTSSVLVLENYLSQLHSHFNSSLIHFAAPNRYTLFVSDEGLLFGQVIESIYNESLQNNEAPLSPDLYVMQDGKIVGTASLGNANEEGIEEDEEISNEDLGLIILSGPVSVFILVAAADGNIDKKELKTFLREIVIMGEKPGTPAPIKKMFQALPNVITQLIQELTSEGLNLENLCKSVIGSSHCVEQAFGKRVGKKYNQILIDIAVKIAGSSGGFLGLGSKIDKHERQVIDTLKRALNVK